MGTNFTWHDQPCQHCGRFDEVHVGKSSVGWSFLFHGYDEYSVFGFPVRSRAGWRRVFTERTGILIDEYGTEYAQPVEWLDELPAPDLPQRLREERNTTGYEWMDRREWRDAEGFRFEPREFS